MSAFDFLVLAPGVPYNFQPHTVVLNAQKYNVEIIGDLELLSRSGHQIKTIGITGTNGKSTTTALMNHVLSECGLKTAMGGNIGKPVMDLELTDDMDALILEISSYQMDLCPTFRPNISILLNITPDHLDRHGSMAAYVAAKAKILEGDGLAIIGIDDDYTMSLFDMAFCKGERKIIPISTRSSIPEGVFVKDNILKCNTHGEDSEIGNLSGLKTLKGTHNQQNTACVYTACKEMGLDEGSILNAFSTYPGLAHRQYLITVKDDVSYINDTQKKSIPTIIHESNAVLGKANAYLAPKADRIAVAWNNISGLGESDSVRVVVTGNPVRPDIAALYNKPYPALEQDGVLRIFVMGGSQGARVFGEVIPQMVNNLSADHKARLEIVQQCREDDIEEVRQAYKESGVKAELVTFFDNVAERLEKCHLFIGRSGASTVSEVVTAGRPAIFVPYPHHKDQQQKRNADAVFDAGGAWVMTQEGFTVDALLARIETFLQSPEALFNAAENARTCGKPDAARKLGNVVTALASGWDKDANKTFDLTQGRD
ncbi:unnamed protein product [Cyprideis torosa]|uniref:Uncharacterized protein n=1 Tax=Cyprideis torosa TaxID=163714 RepID=A0A7R8WLR3_9CRUS|nr:unnamed protein product [Cyprideis torosa]CAG0897583.1 unnamed protein product [Cyprideis torosa]